MLDHSLHLVLRHPSKCRQSTSRLNRYTNPIGAAGARDVAQETQCCCENSKCALCVLFDYQCFRKSITVSVKIKSSSQKWYAHFCQSGPKCGSGRGQSWVVKKNKAEDKIMTELMKTPDLLMILGFLVIRCWRPVPIQIALKNRQWASRRASIYQESARFELAVRGFDWPWSLHPHLFPSRHQVRCTPWLRHCLRFPSRRSTTSTKRPRTSPSAIK